LEVDRRSTCHDHHQPSLPFLVRFGRARTESAKDRSNLDLCKKSNDPILLVPSHVAAATFGARATASKKRSSIIIVVIASL
jgi:hypothetical protein